MASAVIVGGGPVRLFVAIQLKLRCPCLEVRVLEKYADYQRKHVLKIERASLRTGLEDLEVPHPPRR
jgi:2-polyprenyl-6-methoxyphenol hydroxylase-like FAD-dependent oxidoreductase